MLRNNYAALLLTAMVVQISGFRVREILDNPGETISSEALDVHSKKLDIVITKSNSTENMQDDITVFSNGHAAEAMMKASKDFPVHLQYTIWMDQAGQYGPSTGAPARGAQPDALVVIAQEGRNIQPDGWQTVSTCNKGWSWFYNKEGIDAYKAIRGLKGNCHYTVQWNEERTNGQVFGFWGKEWLTPAREKWTNNFGFRLMPYWDCKLHGRQCEEGQKVQCPPQDESLRHHCALWERYNKVLGYIPVGTYYAFPVLDPDQKPIEPYFTEFQNAMKINKLGQPAKQFVGNIDHPGWD